MKLATACHSVYLGGDTMLRDRMALARIAAPSPCWETMALATSLTRSGG